MKRTVLSTFVIFFMQSLFAEENSNSLEALQASDLSGGRLYSFDARSLFGGGSQDINLNKFTTTDTIATGIYSLNTNINDRSLGQLTLAFKHLDASRSAVLCIDEELLQRLDLRQDFLEKLPKVECLTIKNLSPDAYYDVDHSNLTLSISLPLDILNNRPTGYIAPSLFDRGVSTGYLTYDFNTYRSKNDGQKEITNNYMSLSGGLNLAGFNYRHAGSFDSNGSSLGRYRSYLNSISTDILPLNARVTAGDFNTLTYYTDSAPIRGIQLATDMSMRPMSQRSYAPLIKGVANTNALVAVFQNGRKVYERTVPAGNFEINDLTAIGNNGDLTVQVTENGGEKHSFLVPLQGNMNLIRVGQLNYSLASGQYKLNNKVSDDYIAQLSFEYGLSNYVSMHAGTNISHPYQSYLLGFGTNTFLGGFKFDIEHSNATLAQSDRSGEKYQLGYQYNYAPFGTSLNVSSQYQSREYLTLGNTMSLRNLETLDHAEIENLFQTYRLKQQFNVSLYQTLADHKYGSLYLSASQNKYWNSAKNYTQYNIGYSNTWNRLSYSLNFSQSASGFGESNNTKEKRVNLTLSLPLEWRSKRASLYSNIQHSDDYGKPTSANVGISGTSGENNQLSYGLIANNAWNDNGSNSSISTNLNYSFPQIQIGAITGWSDQYTQFGVSARGAIVAHPYGLTLTNNLSDTFTVIHADGAKGADLVNAWGAKVDRFGNAIYSNVSPYEVNTISLNLKNLPLDVNLKANQVEVIPRRFSSTLVEFKTVKTSNILLNVHPAQNQQIPIGVQALDQQGQVIGMFGQSNQLFIEQPGPLKNNIQIVWGVNNEQSCRIEAPPHTEKNTKSSKRFQIIDVECK